MAGKDSTSPLGLANGQEHHLPSEREVWSYRNQRCLKAQTSVSLNHTMS